MKRRKGRPELLPEPKPYYIHGSEYPDSVRVSFADGHTEIYDRRVTYPTPAEYVNMPKTRRTKG